MWLEWVQFAVSSGQNQSRSITRSVCTILSHYHSHPFTFTLPLTPHTLLLTHHTLTPFLNHPGGQEKVCCRRSCRISATKSSCCWIYQMQVGLWAGFPYIVVWYLVWCDWLTQHFELIYLFCFVYRWWTDQSLYNRKQGHTERVYPRRQIRIQTC